MKSVLVAIALLSSSIAVAAPPPTVQPAPSAVGQPDAAAMAAAERLLEAMNYDKLIDRMRDAMIAEAKRSLPAQIEKMSEKKLPADLQTKLINLVLESLTRSSLENKATMRRGIAVIYARHFTAAEIDRMIEIQRDPVMVKMQAKLPQIMAEAMALNQAAMAKEMPRLMNEIKQMIADYVKNSGKSSSPSSS